MKSQKNLVYASAVLIIPLFMYGCGGSDDSSDDLTGTETENINGIPVPPEPDETLNNSTIEGVDVNGNGIRDDVERVIAQEFGNDSVKHAQAKEMAMAEQNLIANPSEGNKNLYTKLISCSDISRENARKITISTVSNEERRLAYANIMTSGLIKVGGDLCQ